MSKLKLRRLGVGLLAALMVGASGCAPTTQTLNREPLATPAGPVMGTPAEGATPVPTAAPTEAPTPTPMPDIKTVEYDGPIYHIFTHCLIAFPDIAYNDTNKGMLDTDCVTPLEYKRMLQQLYDNNFVIIDIHDTFQTVEENGETKVKKKKPTVPEGKKPLIMSVDDIVYDPKKRGDGMVDKIALDENGKLCAAMVNDADGTETYYYDNELIPILESFIEEHPDFAPFGDRPMLAVTGFAGILGYRTQHDSPNRDAEIEKVKPVVAALKEKGWTFGTHSYGHRHTDKMEFSLLQDDTQKVLDEVVPLVGDIDVYFYPYGASVKPGSEKHDYLVSKGFKMFCGVGGKPFFREDGNSVFMDRQVLDGYSVRHYQETFSGFLDVDSIIDTEWRSKKELAPYS